MSLQLSELVRLGKLMNRSIHPSTPDFERQNASRMAHALCEKSNIMPSDAIIIDGDPYVEALKVPRRELLDRIAELEIARDEARERERGRAAAHHSEREAERSRSQEREAVLRGEIAARDASIAERDARIAKLEAELAASKVEDDLRLIKEQVATSGTAKAGVPVDGDAPSAITDQPEPDRINPKAWSRVAWKTFERLAAAGSSKITMARELTRILGRLVTTACVAELLRQRWSPSSGRRYALWGSP